MCRKKCVVSFVAAVRSFSFLIWIHVYSVCTKCTVGPKTKFMNKILDGWLACVNFVFEQYFVGRKICSLNNMPPHLHTPKQKKKTKKRDILMLCPFLSLDAEIISLRFAHFIHVCRERWGQHSFQQVTTAATAKLETKYWLNYYVYWISFPLLRSFLKNLPPYNKCTNQKWKLRIILIATNHFKLMTMIKWRKKIFNFHVHSVHQTYSIHKYIFQIHDPYKIDNRKPFKFALNISSIKSIYY